MKTLFCDIGGTRIRIWGEKSPLKFMDLDTSMKVLKKYLKSRAPQKLVIGIRGVWTSKEKKVWSHLMKEVAPMVKIFSDIELAHHLFFGEQPGIIANAGTGSIVFGKDSNGKTFRAGGLGPFMGDEGSAFWIGREYLKVTYEKKNWLYIRKIVKNKNPIAKIASYSKMALFKAEKSNGPERQIIKQAISHLIALIHDVQKGLYKGKALPVAVQGGLFENFFFRKEFEKSF
ncbi:MAG: BadF/BadG/BcrA/BcrD ATPase family protein [Elusimicrobiota bacterium]